MSIKDLAALIGQQGVWRPSFDIGIDVVITDVRRAYGRTDYQIRAVAGTGTAWVTAHTVQLEKSE